jgi:drug/metabolite transporter (DMT)-like permease
LENPSNSTPKKVTPFLTLTVGVLAVSTASIFIRFAQQEVASLVIAAYRLFLAATLLAIPVFSHYRSAIARLNRRDLASISLAGGFLALHFATWITSLELTTVVSSVVLVTTTPLWVAIFSPLVLKENLEKRAVAGLVFALVGGGIIGVGDVCQFKMTGVVCQGISESWSTSHLFGNFLALFGAWMAAGYLMVGRRVRAKYPLAVYVFLVYGVAAIVLILFALLSRQPLTGFSFPVYLWLVLLAVIPQLIGHSIFNWALAYLPASFVAVTLLGEPIGSSILAFFFLSETPTVPNLFGAILILTGIVLASQLNRQANRYKSTAPASSEHE